MTAASTLTLLALASTAAATAASGKYCCQALESAGLKNVYYPGEDKYIERRDSYYSVSARVEPYCFVQPTTVQEISQTVKTLNYDTICNWAIRSGGHATWPGANNIVDGVTIDLREFKGTTYNPSTQTAQINSGSLWGEVYSDLEPHGVTVAGGRSAPVGVGGFLLGGGNTFYTAQRGFGCDQVVNFEVVLANGETASANATTNPDLYRALKGGSSNFAVVTRFDLSAFTPEPDGLWGGMLVYDGNKNRSPSAGDDDNNNKSTVDEALLEAYHKWASDDGVGQYRSGSVILAWVYDGSESGGNGMMAVAGLVDTSGGAKGDSGEREGGLGRKMRGKSDIWDEDDARNAAPVTFDKFLDVPHLASTIRWGSHLDLISEIDMPGDYRNIWFSITLRNHPSVYRTSHALYKSFISEWEKDRPSHRSSQPSDFTTYAVFQAIPSLFAENSAERGGGNVMGLLEGEGESGENAVIYIVYLLTKGNEEEENMGRAKMAELRAKLKQANKVYGNVRWEYLNYADSTQDPLAAYGEQNVEFMRKVAERYDPEGVFQTRVPGGFKIPEVVRERVKEL